MKCLVTGSTGFIGRATCEALTAAGHDVTCLARQPLPGATPCVVHDLRNPLPAALSLEKYDVVLHMAGIAHQRAPAARHVAVNESATIALAERAARDGVSRFVFLSSVKAMGPPGATPRGEASLATPVGAYATSKRHAELALTRVAAESRMELAILRPAPVYGPGIAGNLATLVTWVRRGLPLIPDAGARSMVSRGDLVRLLSALVSDAALTLPSGGVTWNVTDGEAYSTRRLMLALAAAMQRSAPTTLQPLTVWRLLGACADLRRGVAPGTTAAALLGTELYASQAVCNATGWRPRQRFEDVAPAIVRAAAADAAAADAAAAG